MEIQTNRFSLRLLRPELDDFSRYLSWMKDEIANPFIQAVSNSITIQDLVTYVNSKNDSCDSILFGIFLRNSTHHIGNIKLEPIITGAHAYLGILIGEVDWRGKRVGTEVISNVLDYSFEHLNLLEVRLGVDIENKAALKLYKRLGFKPSIIPADNAGRLELSINPLAWQSRRAFILKETEL
jgi:ribosomal-protein-alanine N-acetyltransferase